MWEDEAGELELFERSFDRTSARAMTRMEGSLFDIESRCLKPLYRIEVGEEEVRVIFDLPCVEKEDVALNATEDMLSIDARMRKPLRLRLGGAHQSHAEFERYSKKILLPVNVEAEKASATFVSGLLTVRLPIRHAGRIIELG